MKLSRLLFVIMALLIATALVACGSPAEETPAPTTAPPTAEVVDTPTDVPPAPDPTAVPEPEPDPTAVPEPEPDPTAVPIEEPEPVAEALPAMPGDVFIRAAYSDDEIALRISWRSDKPYPGQFHDFVIFGGEDWARMSSSARIQEDRLAVMFESPNVPAEYFTTTGCYAACHADMNTMPDQPVNAEGAPIDTRHYLLATEENPAGSFGLDMWHWRGGRSGPMGYAEDTWVRYGERDTGEQGRRRDNQGDAPTNWLREGGDRLYENQNWGGDLIWNETILPRFVFNPEKSGFNNYFLADADGNAFTDVDQVYATVDNVDYVSLLVIYQDLDFDPVDKVNSIDVLYLLYMAGEIDEPEYNNDWAGYWAAQTGVNDADSAIAMLDDIVSGMEDGVMVTRSVGFIYESSQHEIRATRDFDFDEGVWTVTMYRSLSVPRADAEDVDLAALANGVVYNMAFSIHDVMRGGATHYVSFPTTMGNAASNGNIKAVMVDNVWDVDWAMVEPLETAVYPSGMMASLQWLLDKEVHEGADNVDIFKCQRCHEVDFAGGGVGLVED